MHTIAEIAMSSPETAHLGVAANDASYTVVTATRDGAADLADAILLRKEEELAAALEAARDAGVAPADLQKYETGLAESRAARRQQEAAALRRAKKTGRGKSKE